MKAFFNYINSKTATEDETIFCGKENEMREILNKKFQSVFVQGTCFEAERFFFLCVQSEMQIGTYE